MDVVGLLDDYDLANRLLMSAKEADAHTGGAGVSVDEKLDVSVDKIKVCLYSDPLGMQQKYFAPYYVMSGKDGNNEKITIVVPAIENKNVIYK